MTCLTNARWFEPGVIAVAARALMAEVVESCKASSSQRERYSERQLRALNDKTILFLIGAATFIAAVLYVPEFLPGDWLAKDNNLHQVVKWILIVVPLGFCFTSKQRLRRAVRRLRTHESCIAKLCQDHPTLQDTWHLPVLGESIEVLPHLPTGCKSRVHCNLFGEYRSHALAMLETEYREQATIDAQKLLGQLQAGILKDTDREQFSRHRIAETIVFFRPLAALPDLFLGGSSEPLCAFQPQWVKNAGGVLRQSLVQTPFGNSVHAFSSCPQIAAQLFSPELNELLIFRPTALVQVIGGFVIVVPRSWNAATPMDTAVTPFEIQLDLDFALRGLRSAGIRVAADWAPGPAIHARGNYHLRIKSSA